MNSKIGILRTLSQHVSASLPAWAWVTCILLIGCQRDDDVDHANLMLQPGVGIKGVVELGFSIPDTSKHFRKHDVISDASGHILIPAIGFSGYVYKGNRQLAFLRFDVAPMPLGGNKWTQPFTGRLPNGITFSTGDVFRSQIEAAFGKPKHIVEFRGDRSEEYVFAHKQFELLFRTGEPVEYFTGKSISQIHYQTSGIAFNIETGCVYSIMIYPAFKK